MSTGKIIDPKKEERQSLQEEFVQRLNSLTQNALWRGLTKPEVVGILDAVKFGLLAQTVQLKQEPQPVKV